jgi:hypothetical protein
MHCFSTVGVVFLFVSISIWVSFLRVQKVQDILLKGPSLFHPIFVVDKHALKLDRLTGDKLLQQESHASSKSVTLIVKHQDAVLLVLVDADKLNSFGRSTSTRWRKDEPVTSDGSVY